MLERSGKYFLLPLKYFEISDVVWDGLVTLLFNDPKNSQLDIHGEFLVGSDEVFERYSPRSEWIENVLESFIGVEIKVAKANSKGYLFITFADKREIIVEDGPFENWHYTNTDKIFVHGGVGRLTY